MKQKIANTIIIVTLIIIMFSFFELEKLNIVFSLKEIFILLSISPAMLLASVIIQSIFGVDIDKNGASNIFTYTGIILLMLSVMYFNIGGHAIIYGCLCLISFVLTPYSYSLSKD